MDTLFKSSSLFTSLSIKDLIQARDLFHYHLINKKNVVATAIGLYRIRKGDHWPSKDHPTESKTPGKKHGRRTLFNSEIRPYSWPCIYVFVSQWDTEEVLAKENPSDVVPKSLYLPDGRVVPVCVIEAKPQPYSNDLQIDPTKLVPRNMFGPGTAILNEDAQGMPRIATVGCVVRDAERYYAMTNRHAVGSVGTEINAIQTHRKPIVGVTAAKGSGREDFQAIYPHFNSSGQYLLMDVGLIDIDDIAQWKTDFPGISPVQPVLDLYDNSFSMQLIGLKVLGYAAVSGLIRGEIHGLFYRYKSLGGSEYLTDFLIGPETHGPDVKGIPEDREVSLAVHHGDSGTLLFVQREVSPAHGKVPASYNYFPFALLWGREEFFGDNELKAQPFALATSLSIALDRLDLDFVQELNADQEYIWGWVGHYVIGGLLPDAIGLLQSEKLKTFIDANIDLLTLSPDAALDNDPRVLAAGAQNADDPSFVPLADVPDNVWKSNVNFYMTEDGGKKHRVGGPGSRGQNDNPNHFADMDLPYKDYDTFLEFSLKNLDSDPDPEVWLDYYNSQKPKYDAWQKALGKKGAPPFYSHWGALPFRIWQLYDAMVAAAKAKDQSMFLLAGGVLIHYVGDACQPLHTSYLSQGDPDRVVPRPKSDGNKLEADGVHSGYEDDMVNYGWQKKNLGDSLLEEVKRQARDPKETIREVNRGADVANAIIELIGATHQTIEPREIVDKWVELRSVKKSVRTDQMWSTFGPRTVECMARGVRYLAQIWEAAWTTGNGDQNIGKGKKADPAQLQKLYENPAKVPSVRLDKYASILKK